MMGMGYWIIPHYISVRCTSMYRFTLGSYKDYGATHLNSMCPM
jgi:hypothetical protein